MDKSEAEAHISKARLLYGNSIEFKVCFEGFKETSGQEYNIHICNIGSTVNSLLVPYFVSEIDDSAGLNSSIKELIIDTQNKITIGQKAFYGSKLEKLSIQAEEYSILDGSFSNTLLLKDVKLYNRCKSIGNSAFSYSGITEIDIPESTEEVGNCAFEYDEELKNVRFNNEMWYLGNNMFSGCVALTDIMLPKGIKSIRDSVFSGCKSLSNIEIPYGVENIGYDAFVYCNIDKLTLPETVKSIDISNLLAIRKLKVSGNVLDIYRTNLHLYNAAWINGLKIEANKVVLNNIKEGLEHSFIDKPNIEYIETR